MTRQLLIFPALLLCLAGCASLPAFRSARCDGRDPPIIDRSPRGELSTTLDVLIYNVEGLPWPARRGRAESLRAIGATLRRLQADGSAPDVVLFQEVFSPAAIRSVVEAGYPSIASGPSRTRRSIFSADAKLPGRPRPTKGELGIRLMTSGLVVASRYPITRLASDAYSRHACAGFDCLANKGAMLTTLAVPGVPDPIEIGNTHMNARKAARVSPQRSLAAHKAQAAELEAFLGENRDPRYPIILGGDLNMRRSPQRFAWFRENNPLQLVHEYCVGSGKCDVQMSWDHDAPWLDTQDLQFFAPGSRVKIKPIRVQAMFDGAPGRPALSDHDGFRVVYRLSWPEGTPPAPRLCPAS